MTEVDMIEAFIAKFYSINLIMEEPLTYRIEPMIGTQHYYDTKEDAFWACRNHLRKLDGCHMMEEWLVKEYKPILSGPQLLDYYESNLARIVLGRSVMSQGKAAYHRQDGFKLAHATVLQRWEAMARTLWPEKWDEFGF